jgi:hypothetical protein
MRNMFQIEKMADIEEGFVNNRSNVKASMRTNKIS